MHRSAAARHCCGTWSKAPARPRPIRSKSGLTRLAQVRPEPVEQQLAALGLERLGVLELGPRQLRERVPLDVSSGLDRLEVRLLRHANVHPGLSTVARVRGELARKVDS
jgi:hypothetical protein